MDKTKYDLKITNKDGISDFQSLDKVEIAFKIIECLIDLELESKDEINNHKFIRYTLLLSKDELEGKTPDIKGRYKRNLENHDLYFSRMWNKEELENLITYVEENYVNIFTISESVQNSDANINLLPEILEVLEEDPIIDLCELEEFRYQKGSDKLIEFEKYNDLSKQEITLLLNQFNDSGLTFTNFVQSLDKESDEYQLLILLGEVVSYCDLHAANKKFYNQYDDNRTLGKAGVRMNDWLDKLLNYKLADNDLEKLTPSIKNALLYLKDPEKGLTMLSENHREKFSINLLHKTYEPESIIDDLISFFEPYDIEVSNDKNRTTVYCSILYTVNVKQLWLNGDNIEIDEENPETKNTNDMKIPLNQIFYGPPGTGKTYNISSEAEIIINEKNNSASLNFKDKILRINDYLRNNFSDNKHHVTNGSNIYRNPRAIVWMWGWLLDTRWEEDNVYNKLELIEAGVPGGPSSWSQRIRYITHFGFVDDWESSSSIELNEFGLEFKGELKQYITNENISIEELKDWDQEIPSLILDKYLDIIASQSPLNTECTPFIKSFYNALSMAANNDLYRQNTEAKERLASEYEQEISQKYFDFTCDPEKIKWIGWYAKILEEFGIVETNNKLIDNRYSYFITDFGESFINIIIANWEIKYPALFAKKIKFEDAYKIGRVEFITFHQSYSYEEFIEGIRPNLDGDNNLSYSLETGIFKRISDRAKGYQENNYVIIIDEINRGNISKIFGELITLIEPSKRLFTKNDEHPKKVTLPYSKKPFGVPKNLYILGTMNTADKSIALLDSALRRRFSFTEMLPKSSVIKDNISIEGIEVEKLFETINSRIEFLIDKDHTIGHSYFLKIKDNQTIEALAMIFKNEIIPLLTEYFYGDFKKIQLVVGDNNDWKSQDESKFFIEKKDQQKSLFGEDEVVEGYDEKVIFELNDDLLGLNEDGSIKGKQGDLVQLFKSVYTKKEN